MNINLECGTVYCHICNKDIDLHADLINVGEAWLCLACDTVLGYDSDLIGILTYKKDENINGE